MTVQLRDLMSGFRDLHFDEVPVIVHASLKSFGQVDDGAQTVVSALTAVFPIVVVPTFTYKTMVTPLDGPEHNAIKYGSGTDLNRMAEFFTPEMPADPLMGIISETLRKYPNASRSIHPIQSFAGINADEILATQRMVDPLAPLGALEQADGWVVLIGVDHTANTSIHYAEKLTGRRQFVRWALTLQGVVECPGFPGCSTNFQAIAPELDRYTRRAKIGEAQVQAVSLNKLFEVVVTRLKKDPLALLCQQEDCERCGEVRREFAHRPPFLPLEQHNSHHDQ